MGRNSRGSRLLVVALWRSTICRLTPHSRNAHATREAGLAFARLVSQRWYHFRFEAEPFPFGRVQGTMSLRRNAGRTVVWVSLVANVTACNRGQGAGPPPQMPPTPVSLATAAATPIRSEEHTSELQSH